VPPKKDPPRVRIHRRGRRLIALALAIPALAAACGGSSGALPTTAPPASGPSTTALAQPTTSSSPPTTTSASVCSLSVIEAISGESASADEARTASWVTLSASNWTVFVPNGSWHLSASTAGGADIVSPDGHSDASLGNPSGLSPLSYAELTGELLSGVSDIKVICQSPNERNAAGETQATELTGVYEGVAVHIVYALTILTPTTSGFFGGETRSIFTPVSQWSTSAEEALWLIIKRAIFSPSAP
jgi:hypothetical protein